jgi:hypothetical protein
MLNGMKTENSTLPSHFQEFEYTSEPEAEKEGKLAITLWIPASKKMKFERIQKATKNKLGKHLQDQVCTVIDRAKDPGPQ